MCAEHSESNQCNQCGSAFIFIHDRLPDSVISVGLSIIEFECLGYLYTPWQVIRNVCNMSTQENG